MIFAHGSGSGRTSPRNLFVAQHLQRGGFATLLLDLLTEDEQKLEQTLTQGAFDLERLTQRLILATEQLLQDARLRGLRFAYFGASSGAAVALQAAALLQKKIAAIVSRGGRPDLASSALPAVQSPTLLLVGEKDQPVLDLNKRAHLLLTCEKALQTIEGATHLFEEPGALEAVARIALDWFTKWLATE